MPIPGLLLFLEFLCQPYPDLHAVDEAGAFVVAAESADWIHDLIHLPERHAVHEFIQLVEILLDLVIVHQVDFRQLLSRGKITFYSLIFMEWAMNCKVCVLWALW